MNPTLIALGILWLISFACVLWHTKRAPRGYQDRRGFHYGDGEETRRK